MTFNPDSPEYKLPPAVEKRMRGCFRAARRLSIGDDPIDIGKYAFEPFAEKLAEIFRNAPKKPPVLCLHYDREIDRRFIRAYAEAIGEDDPDQAAKIYERLEAPEREEGS